LLFQAEAAVPAVVTVWQNSFR